jgi:UrcA family protein
MTDPAGDDVEEGTMLNAISSSTLLGATCALGMLAAGAPAICQEPAAEFTVTGHTEGPHERSLSAAVFYVDLDLTTAAGQTALRQRVRRAAAELCHQLGGGPENATGLAFVCEDEAVQSAVEFQRSAIAHATPPTYVAASLKAAPAR